MADLPEQSPGESKTEKNIRTGLNCLYKWAIREEGPLPGAKNPIQDVATVDVPRAQPVVWSVRDVARWLDGTVTAEAEKKVAQGSVAGQALLFFSGIRPSELIRLEPKDIGTHEIHLPAGSTKTNAGRIVPISDNLKAWLTRYPHIKRSESNLKRLRVQVREYSGIEYHQDVARHCYITAICCTQSMSDAAVYAGNTEKVINRHYLGLMANRKKWALDHFQLRP